MVVNGRSLEESTADRFAWSDSIPSVSLNINPSTSEIPLNISQNWRGKPLVSHEVIVNLIASTTTRKGLTVKCELDTNKYTKGIKVTDNELKQVNIIRDEFHGEWNYSIHPIIS